MKGYLETTNPPIDAVERRPIDNNSKAMNSILSRPVCSEFMKVMYCELAKDMWGKLQTIYEGDEKVKEAKLQTYRAQFEVLEMKEDENVVSYFLKVDEL